MHYAQKNFSRNRDHRGGGGVSRPPFVRPAPQQRPQRTSPQSPIPPAPITSRRLWWKKLKLALRELSGLIKKKCAIIHASADPVSLVPFGIRHHERAVNLARKISGLKRMEFARR